MTHTTVDLIQSFFFQCIVIFCCIIFLCLVWFMSDFLFCQECYAVYWRKVINIFSLSRKNLPFPYEYFPGIIKNGRIKFHLVNVLSIYHNQKLFCRMWWLFFIYLIYMCVYWNQRMSNIVFIDKLMYEIITQE